MEEYHQSPMNYVNNIFRKKLIFKKMTTIEKEYSLKKSLIDPNNKSPNMFLHKLERRMCNYYCELYNSKKQQIK